MIEAETHSMTTSRMSAARLATAGVLLAWTLLAVGDSAAEGQYSNFALTCVVLGLVVLVVVVATGRPLAVADPVVLAIPVVACLIAALHHPASRYIAMSATGLRTTQVLIVAASIVACLSLYAEKSWATTAAVGIAALVAGAGVTTVILDSHPAIDVWVFLQQSSHSLVYGHDMYRDHWVGSPPGELQDVYPYLPLTTVLLTPFRWLLGDVRYGLIGATLLAAFLLRKASPQAPPALAVLMLIVPHYVFLIDQSWTEPLLVACMAALFLALRSERPVYAVIALAVALACKQHIAILLPLFAIWPQFGLRRTIASGALALTAALPWLIAGPSDVWHDAVSAELSLPVQSRALNLPSLFFRHGHVVGFWFLLVVVCGTYALVYYRVPRTISGLALGAGLVMYALNVANKATYFNHYMLPLGLLVIAVASADRGRIGASRPVPDEERLEPSS